MPTIPSTRAVLSLLDVDDELAPVVRSLAGISCADPFTSFTTGAGLSGSGPPAGVSWIHRTTWPLLYVCSVLNSSDAADGRGPAEIVKRWNSPGLTVPPDHVTCETASVTGPSSVCTGFGSFVFEIVSVHPGTGSTLTDGIGWSVGMTSSTCTVFAPSISFGTENVKVANWPTVASSGDTVTCADAGSAHASTTTATSATGATRRTAGRTIRTTISS